MGRWLIEQGELQAGTGLVAGAIKAWAQLQPEARQRTAVGQPALRVLPRGAAARSRARARAARRACR
ncbi:MAG: hypothetical protein MZW92_66655 [Comamonadaceae bacterium]|nr:hypothetical protein [Comamonadaceae bacterium]